MSRAERLLDLLQILRRYRQPVTGAALAAECGISLRSLYRDIATLQGQGAMIEGAAGLGYVLRPGTTLPPLMFSAEEIEALVLGSRWVADRGDARLAAAARDALAKISAVLPGELRDGLEGSSLLVGPGGAGTPDERMALIRAAVRAERKLVLEYCDRDGEATRRVIWPIALGFFDRAELVVGWCELRQDFRHFRTDRIEALAVTEQRYPRRRAVLLKEWRESQGIAADGI